MDAPLTGVRVVELGMMIAVPAAAQLLASFGASVTKVEDTALGDGLRFYGSRKNGLSGWFLNTNAGKRSIALDLKTDAGREILWRLIDDADVLVEGFRAGVLDRLGFGYDAVRDRNPGIVYCASTGYGHDGPYADRPVFDPLIQTTSGWAAAQQVDGRPTLVRSMVSDKVGAWHNALTILAALYRSGPFRDGQPLRNSMLDANLAFVWPDVMMDCTLLDEDGVDHLPNILQTYRLFRCRDGWITMALGTDAQWAAACEALGREGLATDPRFVTAVDRGANIEAWYEEQEAMVAGLTAGQAVERLVAADVPASAVLATHEVHEDPQVRAAGLLEDTEHPVAGRYRGPRPRAAAAGDSLELSPAPRQGEHTREILGELGFSPEETRAWLDSGAVRSAD